MMGLDVLRVYNDDILWRSECNSFWLDIRTHYEQLTLLLVWSPSIHQSRPSTRVGGTLARLDKAEGHQLPQSATETSPDPGQGCTSHGVPRLHPPHSAGVFCRSARYLARDWPAAATCASRSPAPHRRRFPQPTAPLAAFAGDLPSCLDSHHCSPIPYRSRIAGPDDSLVELIAIADASRTVITRHLPHIVAHRQYAIHPSFVHRPR